MTILEIIGAFVLFIFIVVVILWQAGLLKIDWSVDE